MARNVLLIRLLLGRPKEILLIPRIERVPIDESPLRLSRVNRAFRSPAPAARVRGSTKSIFLGSPIFSPASAARSARASLPFASSGIPLLSIVRTTTADPVFNAAESPLSSTSGSHVTEFRSGIPATDRAIFSRIWGSSLSIESGRFTAPSTAVTAAEINSMRSWPGIPPLISITSAPASAWSRASSLTWAQFRAIIASLRGPFRDGLILSPTTSRDSPSPQRDMRVRLASTVWGLGDPGTGRIPASLRERAWICRGGVPQHPPMTVAPASASPAQASAKGSGASHAPCEGSPPFG